MTEITGKWTVNNNITVNHPTHECAEGGLCAYPYCEHELSCKNKPKKQYVKEVKKVGSIKQYFDYQEELNTLKTKISKIESAQKNEYL